MKLAHLSDLHLGYAGAGPGRAGDVLEVFEGALGRVAELGPELVVVAGDIFDHPEVTAAPLAAFSRGIRTLRGNLPGVVVAIAAGARDMPLERGRHGPLTVIGGMDGVEVADTRPRRLHLRGGRVCVTLVPHPVVLASRSLDLSPDPAAERNILVLHAELASGRSHALPVPMDGWDYVALGSSHGYRRVGERACYSGSLERVGADPWEEAAIEKGFVTVQLESGEPTFWPVEARAAVSLAPMEAAGGGTATVARRLGEALAGVPGGIDGKLLKVPVRGLSAEDLAVLDREILAGVRRRVAWLRLEALPAGRAAGTPGVTGGRSRASPASAARRIGAGAGRGRDGRARFRISALQAGPRGLVLDLHGSRGLVAFAADDAALWDRFVAGLREAFAGGGRHAGPGPALEWTEGAVNVGTPEFEEMLGPVLDDHAIGRDEFAGLWFGEGGAKVWLAAAAALVAGPGVTGEMRRSEGTGGTGDAGARTRPGGPLARWVERMGRDAAIRVERLDGIREGMEELEARLRAVREEEEEARGRMEVSLTAWLRERQDAETRLLLYRDRERELRGQLKGIEEAGDGGPCGSCGRPLGDRAGRVRQARGEAWEAVVQDGRWWRRRRDQLEARPGDLRAAEARVAALGGEMEALSEELARRRLERAELEAAVRHLDQLGEVETLLGPGSAPAAETDVNDAEVPARGAEMKRATVLDEVRERVRARIHAKAVALTGGRLARAFPRLFAAWAGGGRRMGEDVAVLELAARVVLAELALEAGVDLGSVVLPAGLDRLHRNDRPGALAALAGLARVVPLVMVHASPCVVATAPERFDFVHCVRDAGEGGGIRRRRSGLGVVWLGGT